MHKLFWTDFFLILLTLTGLLYLYTTNQITFYYALIIFLIYTTSKIIGFFLLPYSKFEEFIKHLSKNSKLSYLSGFEIFKTILVGLLFIGFIFIDPSVWIIESILVVAMRVWGISYINCKE